MSLRNRLLILLGAFAAFAVVVTATTIHAIRWQVEGVVQDFERTAGRTVDAGRLHVVLTEQIIHLRDVVDGHRDATRPYFMARDEFSTKLRQLTSFAPDAPASAPRAPLLALARTLEEEADECLALLEAQKFDDARNLFATRLEGELLPALDSRLLAAQARLDEARNLAAREVVATSTQILMLTIGVGLLAAGLWPPTFRGGSSNRSSRRSRVPIAVAEGWAWPLCTRP